VGDNIDTTKNNSETHIDGSKELGLEANAEKTKYMLLSNQNEGQNPDVKMDNRSCENGVQFKCFGTTVTNKNLIQVEIKWRLNSGNASYLSV
jgi:hypothetical protein